MSVRRLSCAVAINVVANLIAAGVIYLGTQVIGTVPRDVVEYVLGAGVGASVVMFGIYLISRDRRVAGCAVLATACTTGAAAIGYCLLIAPDSVMSLPLPIVLGVWAVAAVMGVWAAWHTDTQRTTAAPGTAV